MIRKLRYVNSRGDEVAFGGGSGPWHFGKLDIFNLSLERTEVGGSVAAFHPGVREMSLAVFMREGSAAEHDRFIDVVSYDTHMCQPGTLWAGDSWMRCWIPSVELSEWRHYDSMCVFDCTVLSDRPVWVRSVVQDITPAGELEIGGLDYPYDFPHDYLFSGGTSVTVRNPFMLPAKVDIAFPGPCVWPYVIIGPNRYQVRATVEAGQLLLVRGYGDKDIVVRHSDGTERSVFAQGVREDGAQIFAEVPVGDSVASWSGGYNVGLTLYEERMSPSWSM